MLGKGSGNDCGKRKPTNDHLLRKIKKRIPQGSSWVRGEEATQSTIRVRVVVGIRRGGKSTHEAWSIGASS